MPVSQVLLKVSPVNDLAQAAVTVDVTADILAVGKTAYNIGSASTTRWFWAVITDSAGNSNTFPLGSYTTAAAASTSVTIEASRLFDTADPYYSGVVGTLTGTDAYLSTYGNYCKAQFAAANNNNPFTIGVRLKFANTNTFTNTNNNYEHRADFNIPGANVCFNLMKCTGSGDLFDTGVKWVNRKGTLIAAATTVMKTSFFWMFLTGTPGGTLRFRAFNTDDVTLTANSQWATAMPALTGALTANIVWQFGKQASMATTPNQITIDKFWYKPEQDAAVTPASTV